MGKHKSRVSKELDHHDDDIDEMVDEIDIDDLVRAIHEAEEIDVRRRWRGRHARRRLDDLAHERALREELFDWTDDFDDDYNYDDWN